MTRWIDGLEQEALRLLPEAVGRVLPAGQRRRCDRRRRPKPPGATSGCARTCCGTSRRCRRGTVRCWVRRSPPRSRSPRRTAATPRAIDEGEVAMARGAAAAGSLVCVSSNAGIPYADIAAAGAPWWVQVYVLRRPRAHRGAAGPGGRQPAPSAVVLTVDTPVVATKRRRGPDGLGRSTHRSDFLHANHDAAWTARDHASLEKAADLTPDVDRLADASAPGCRSWSRACCARDDARRAVEAGAAAVWVSNHGGRQLDRRDRHRAGRCPRSSTRCRGGPRCTSTAGCVGGLDLMAALRARGDAPPSSGRPALWALTVGGGRGRRAACSTTFADELVEAMRLAGCVSRAELTPDLVRGR